MEVVDCFLKHGVNINATLWSNQANATSLHRAVELGDAGNLVTLLANKDVDVNKMVTLGCTALMLALQQGHMLLVGHLVKKGAQLNLCIENITCLHIAVKKNRKDLVDILIQHGADVNCSRQTYGTFFAAVSSMGTEHEKTIRNLNKTVLKQLVELGVALNAQQCVVPLIHDTLSDSVMMRHLTHHGTDINAVKLCYTAFAEAIKKGDCKTIGLLIECGVDVHATFESNVTILHEAVQQKCVQEITLLEELGANVNCHKMTGLSTISMSRMSGNEAVSKYLSTAGVDINTKVCFESPLLSAVRNDDFEGVVALVEKGAEVNKSTMVVPTWLLSKPTRYETVPDIFSLQDFSDEQLEHLVELGVDLNTTEDRVPIIFEAVKCHKPNILKYLVQHGADIFKHTVRATYLMKHSLYNKWINFHKNCDWVDAMINSKPQVSDLAHDKCLQEVKRLLHYGADVNAACITQISLLAAAVKSGNCMIVRAVVKLGAPVYIDNHHHKRHEYLWEETPLGIIFQAGDFDLVRDLIQIGADVSRKNNHCESALHHAVAIGDPKLLRALCCLKPNVNSLKQEGMTVFHHALQHKTTDLKMIKVLVEAGADLNSTFSDYVTPLHDAARLGNTEIVETLKEFGADMNRHKIECKTSVHEAAYKKRVDILEYFAEMGADLEVKHNQQVRPLNEAVRVGDIEMVKCLVRCGANLAATKNCRLTPLFAAILGGDSDIVKCLIQHGADVNAKVDMNVGLLHDAIEYGNTGMIEALLMLGANVFSEKQETSMFGICVTRSLIEMANCLLARGSEIHEKQVTFISAFEDAQRRSSTQSVDILNSFMSMLMVTMIDIGVENRDHASSCLGSLPWTALDMACSMGDLDIVHYLILHGCHATDRVLKRLPFLNIGNYSALTETISAKCISKSIPLSSDYEPRLKLPLITIEAIHHTIGIGDAKYVQSPKSIDVATEVTDLVTSLVKNLQFFKGGKVQCVGSMGEGSKVMLPDEMDFLVSFEIQNYKGPEVEDAGFGYARFKNEGNTLLQEGSHFFHVYFTMDIMNAFPTSKKTATGRVQVATENIDGINDQNRKACSVLPIKWNDGKLEFMISVDVVPCLHVKDWPKKGTRRTWLMDYATLKSRGYLIVPKPPHIKSVMAKQCTEKDLVELWVVSFAHLETEHMQQLDQRVKNVYLTAKSLRSPEVCRIFIKEEDSYEKPVDKYVTSYLLKMMFLKNVEDFLSQDLDLDIMVLKVYDDLVEALTNEFVPIFFMPEENALNGRKLEPRKCEAVARIMQKFVHKMYDRDHQADSGQVQPNEAGACTESPVYLTFMI